MSDSQDCVPLRGLDGANPLGFLAALGLLKVMSRHPKTASMQMAWISGDGTWIPKIRVREPEPLNGDLLCAFLAEVLVVQRAQHPANLYEELTSNSEPKARRSFFEKVCRDSSESNRDRVDFLAAIASDVASDAATNQAQTTRRDYHLQNIDSILRKTTVEHLRRSVLVPWDYADSLDNQSLHLDPSEDRRHAYQWNKPSGDPNRKRSGGMMGANRLAIEAIELLTSFPDGEDLVTTGFTGNRSYNTRLTWPLWEPYISLDTVRSLLTLKDLQEEEPSSRARRLLAEMGVAAVFRTERILVQKTPNFTPARRVP